MRLMRFLSLIISRHFGRWSGSPVLWAVPPRVGGGSSLAPTLDRSQPEDDDPSVDPDDLHRLMIENGDAVFRLALSIVRDRSLAEDVTQETMVKAWLALPSFRGESSRRGWVMRIAHNTAISMLRTRRALVSDPAEMPEEPWVSERSIERRVEGAVVVDEFVAALDLLDDLSRSIVVLREIEGMSYDEIAQILEVPLPTIKTRLLRARRRLGVALKEWQ